MTMKTFRVEVLIHIDQSADPFEVMENMEYHFLHEHIRDTEIVDATVSEKA